MLFKFEGEYMKMFAMCDAHGLYSFMLKLVVHLQEPGHFVIVGLILSV
jgi:hypothetical protein